MQIPQENGTSFAFCSSQTFVDLPPSCSVSCFARKYVNKGREFWSKVLFTDETQIAIRNDSNKTRLRRKTGERLLFVTPTVKHPPAVMMWGAFAANGVGRIRFLEKNETCNSAWYLKVLDKQVRWSASLLFNGTFYLQAVLFSLIVIRNRIKIIEFT